MWLKHLDPQKNNSKTWLRTGKRPWWFIVSPEPCRFQMKKPSIKTQYQFLLEPKGCQLVIVWWETPLGSPLRLFISSILKNAWHMIVLIWVHYFDTWKTTLFSGCQIFKDQHECMISNINEKRTQYTEKSTIDQEWKRSRTEGPSMTMSVLTQQFVESSPDSDTKEAK